MAGHAQLKFVMTECSKTQIRLTGLKLLLCVSSIPVNKALAIGDLTTSLDHIELHGFAFPLFFHAILSKIRQTQCRVVFIAPLWPHKN